MRPVLLPPVISCPKGRNILTHIQLGIPTANIPPSGLDAYPDLESGVYFGFVGLKITAATRQESDNSGLTLSSPSTTGGGGEQGVRHSTGGTGAEAGAGAGEEGVNVYPAVLSIGLYAPHLSLPFPESCFPSLPPPLPLFPIILHPSNLYLLVLLFLSHHLSLHANKTFQSNPFYANKTRSIEIHILTHHFATYNFYHSPLNLLVLGFIRPEYDYKSLEDLVSDIKMDCDVARDSLRRDGYRDFIGEGNQGKSEWGSWLREFGWWEGVSEAEVRRVEERETGKGEDSKTTSDAAAPEGKL